MAINPSIIKHGIDDEEYSTACPTLGNLMLARFSTPEQHSDILYQTDGLFFAMHTHRRMYLRMQFPNEFDIWTTAEDFNYRPKLYVLVTLLSEGFHERTPRWRGRPFLKSCESDEDVAKVLFQMAMRDGLSLSDWAGFIQDQRIRNNDQAKSKKSSKVN